MNYNEKARRSVWNWGKFIYGKRICFFFFRSIRFLLIWRLLFIWTKITANYFHRNEFIIFVPSQSSSFSWIGWWFIVRFALHYTKVHRSAYDMLGSLSLYPYFNRLLNFTSPRINLSLKHKWFANWMEGVSLWFAAFCLAFSLAYVQECVHRALHTRVDLSCIVLHRTKSAMRIKSEFCVPHRTFNRKNV